MAVWKVFDTAKGMRLSVFDDGLGGEPGDEGFSEAAIEAYAGPNNYLFLRADNDAVHVVTASDRRGPRSFS